MTKRRNFLLACEDENVAESISEKSEKSENNNILSRVKKNADKRKERMQRIFDKYKNENEENESESDINNSDDEKDIKFLVKKAKPELIKDVINIKQHLEKQEPDIVNILATEMLIDDKAEIVELYELYKITEFSLDKISLKKKINSKIQDAKEKWIEYKKYSIIDHNNFTKELEKLESGQTDYKEIKYKILSLETSMENKRIIFNRYKRFLDLSNLDEEYSKSKNWLDTATSLPYDKIKTFSFNKSTLATSLRKVAIEMDKELYGMKNVKEQILVFLHSRILNPSSKRCSLSLLGPPGVGKTYIARLLSRVIDLPFEQISFGGISDTHFLKGHSYTYIGSEPGEIVKKLSKLGVKNGILFFDEFNRIQNHELVSLLLHITDPVQNNDFQDNFLSGIKIDLSYLWFIFSMNDLPTDLALRDRLYTIKIEGYTKDEKIKILKDYLFPRALENSNLVASDVIMTEDISQYIIETFSSDKEEGVRSLEKIINDVCKKLSFIKTCQKNKNFLSSISFLPLEKCSFPIKLHKELLNSLCSNIYIPEMEI